MADKSTNLSNAMINLVLRNVAYSPSTANVFVALFTGAVDGAFTNEVSTSGTNYSRKQVTFSAASSGSTANSAEVDFGVATGNYGNVQNFALVDNSTGGNILYFDALTVAQTISTGNQPKFAIGAITVSES